MSPPGVGIPAAHDAGQGSGGAGADHRAGGAGGAGGAPYVRRRGPSGGRRGPLGGGPGRERGLVVQSLKAAAAALLAWVVARLWLGDPMALMAPWVALVLMQATVYSSLIQATRQFAAICIGALVASGAQAVTGDTTGALALSVPVLMLLSNWPASVTRASTPPPRHCSRSPRAR